jgi:hypothetical protein
MKASGVALMSLPLMAVFAVLLLVGFWKLALGLAAAIAFWLLFYAGMGLIDKSRR